MLSRLMEPWPAAFATASWLGCFVGDGTHNRRQPRITNLSSDVAEPLSFTGNFVRHYRRGTASARQRFVLVAALAIAMQRRISQPLIHVTC